MCSSETKPHPARPILIFAITNVPRRRCQRCIIAGRAAVRASRERRRKPPHTHRSPTACFFRLYPDDALMLMSEQLFRLFDLGEILPCIETDEDRREHLGYRLATAIRAVQTRK